MAVVEPLTLRPPCCSTASQGFMYQEAAEGWAGSAKSVDNALQRLDAKPLPLSSIVSVRSWLRSASAGRRLSPGCSHAF